MAARNLELAILIMDLDQFKGINDADGHPAGDGLLRKASRRILATNENMAEVARLGGDEFALVQAI